MEKCRAKFRCNYISEEKNGNKTAHMSAVYSTDGENADYSKATPCGSLSITIDAGVPAIDFFVSGETYYLDFTKIEAVK